MLHPERIRSAPRDDGSSDEDVIVVNSDDTTLTLSHDHSLLTASSCVKLTSARMQCSRRAASYMYAVHIAVDPHAIDNLLDVGNGPSIESTSDRVQSNKVKGEAPLLKLAFGGRLGYLMNLTPFSGL